MELNRDLTIVAAQSYIDLVNCKEFLACDVMAASGVKGVRLAVEIENIKKKIILNDINPLAYKIMLQNIKKNNVKDVCKAFNMDANMLLCLHAKPKDRFSFIDLDPFGSPAPFLDSALKALKNNGLIALTATDTASLCGIHPYAAFRKYSGFPLRTEYCHEIAVRLLIGCLALTAAKHDISVKPVFSYAANHYVRVYALCRYGALLANESIKKLGLIAHCFNCMNRFLIQGFFNLPVKCDLCKGKLNYAGPLWIKEIIDKKFCEEMLANLIDKNFKLKRKEENLLIKLIEEAEAPATYYMIDEICDKLNIRSVKVEDAILKLREKGFSAFKTHFKGSSLKTNANINELKNILKELSSKV
jgi:tRNA (guanine26-N2/guanine27-N2)-dimethyltransferase